MADHDPYETRATRRRGDTEPNVQGDAGRPAYGEPVNPDWRGARATRRTRRAQRLPGSRQEFLLWLQFGGWRVLLAAVVLVGVMIWLIWLTSRPNGTPSPFSRPTDELVASGSGSGTLPQQPTITPRPTGAAVTAVAGTGNTSGGAQLRVFNTEGEGLFLRQDHSSDSQVLKTLPDGTIVTVVGPDFSGPDRVWKNIREPGGSTGWAAADFLQAAQ